MFHCKCVTLFKDATAEFNSKVQTQQAPRLWPSSNSSFLKYLLQICNRTPHMHGITNVCLLFTCPWVASANIGCHVPVHVPVCVTCVVLQSHEPLVDWIEWVPFSWTVIVTYMEKFCLASGPSDVTECWCPCTIHTSVVLPVAKAPCQMDGPAPSRPGLMH